MKRDYKRILSMPISYVVTISMFLLIVVSLFIQKRLDLLTFTILLGIGIVIVLNIYFGSVVLKTIGSSFIILYATSLYTYLVIDAHGYITQPFLFTIASATLFLALSYDNNYSSLLRSRNLWTTIVVIILVIFKSTFIMSGITYWVSELLGLNLLVVFILLWKVWINNSNKTKIINPIVIEEEKDSKFKYIYIENELDFDNKKWIGENFNKKNDSAYPYIYNETMKAHKENLALILVSKAKTIDVYDVGEISLNKNDTAFYLYTEAKNNDYFDSTVNNFLNEIELRKQSNKQL